ncbi:hypothetical protein CEXT_699421 [Caerostris extrusa]|uniref:Uncharacterized protein n=1 Tax=Caerostris extrusa TaxID=172846 RepID=A0AAV4W793_CAEEX|nr:hypothetical protein CEXT_699421 [Caerostris extrusa]
MDFGGLAWDLRTTVVSNKYSGDKVLKEPLIGTEQSTQSQLHIKTIRSDTTIKKKKKRKKELTTQQQNNARVTATTTAAARLPQVFQLQLMLWALLPRNSQGGKECLSAPSKQERLRNELPSMNGRASTLQRTPWAKWEFFSTLLFFSFSPIPNLLLMSFPSIRCNFLCYGRAYFRVKKVKEETEELDIHVAGWGNICIKTEFFFSLVLMATFLYSSFMTPRQNWWGSKKLKGDSVAEGRLEQTTSIELGGRSHRAMRQVPQASIFILFAQLEIGCR